MNWVIIGALVVQTLFSTYSKLTGAVLGYLITTGILGWGLSVYADGDTITFLKIELSQPVFLLVCLVWYGYDTLEFLKAKKIASENNDGDSDVRQSSHRSPITFFTIFLALLIALWFFTGIYVGHRVKSDISEFVEKNSKNCNFRIENFDHKNNLLSANGQFQIFAGELCKKDVKTEDLVGGVVKYKINNMITSEGYFQYDWEFSEEEDQSKTTPILKAHGSGKYDFNKNLNTDIVTSEMASYSDNEVIRIEPFKGDMSLNDAEYNINLTSPRIISRDEDGSTDIQGISLKANIKKNLIGLGSLALTVDKFSTQDSSAEGISLSGESLENKDRINSKFNVTLNKGVFDDYSAHGVQAEIGLKNMSSASFKEITKVYDDTSFDNMTLDDQNKIKNSIRELLLQGMSVGITKFQGMISSGRDQGGLDGQLDLTIKPDLAGDKSHINLDRNLTSSSQLVLKGNLLETQQKKDLIQAGFVVISPEGLKSSYEYTDGVLLLNGKINDNFEVSGFIKEMENNLNTMLSDNSQLLSDNNKQNISEVAEESIDENEKFSSVSQNTKEISTDSNNISGFKQCMENADGVTVDMLNCIAAEHEIQDKRLNQIYKEVMPSLSPENKYNLKQEQRAWIKKRETECKQRSAEFEGGTLEQVTYSDCMRELTEKRANEIQKIAESIG